MIRRTPKPSEAEITIEDETLAKAQTMLVPLAEDLEALTEATLDGARETLAHGLEWRLKERVQALEEQASHLAQQVASAVFSQRALRWLTRHAGKAEGLHHGIGTGLDDQQHTERTARRLVHNLSVTRLVLGAVGLVLAVGGTAALDWNIVQHLVFEGAGDNITGAIPEEMYWPLMAMSAATVAGYTLASIFWHWRKERGLAVLLYAFIFAWMAQQLWASVEEQSWWVWRVGLLLLKTAPYSIPGVLLMVAEQSLVWVVGMLRDRNHAAEVVRAAENYSAIRRDAALLMQKMQDANYLNRTVTRALRHALDAMQHVYIRLRDKAGTVLHTEGTKEEDRERARVQYHKALACLEQLTSLLLVVVMLAGLLTGCDNRPKPADARPEKPRWVIAVDRSDGSPARNAVWMQSLFPYVIDQQVKGWPLGGFINTIGCGDMTQPPDEDTNRMQKRSDKSGLSRADAVLWLHTRLMALSEATRTKPYKRSELTACMREAAKHLNAASHDNVVLFLTDCAEWQAGGVNCEAGNKPCKLPSPDFVFPDNTSVYVVGCGVGYNGNHARHLQNEWGKFFERAGVSKARLHIRA